LVEKLPKNEIAEVARMAIIAGFNASNFHLQLARAVEEENNGTVSLHRKL
jgi:hypothetical protein